MNTQPLVVLLDIDNTLYSDAKHGHVSRQMRAALIEYVQNKLQLTPEDANDRVVRYFLKYGLTVCGLMHEVEGIDPQAVTDFVYYRCDFSALEEDSRLRETISCLNKHHHFYYLTNAPRRHAHTVLQKIGLSTDEFSINGWTYEDQWAHTMPHFCNKPHRAAYEAFLGVVRKWLNNPEWLEKGNVVMVDDSACNLVEPLALGWNAVWVSHGEPIPDILMKHMHTKRLFYIKDATELEKVILQIEERMKS